MNQIDRYLIIDESGNLGSSGRYFVIACIDTNNIKSLHNIMHKKLGIAKQKFPELSKLHSNEVKAKDAYPCIKYHILECIASKDVSISYIVADLKHVESNLLEDKNIFYNYLMKLLIDRIVTKRDNSRTIHIMSDNHTTKVTSTNSLSDYLKVHLIYDKGLKIKINFRFFDSDAKDAFIIQAADYVANAIYGKYEYDVSIYFNRIQPIIVKELLFPRDLFGK